MRAGLAALAVGIATAVVAVAGRAPLSRSVPVDASSARAPVTALAVLLIGAGLLLLAAVVGLVWRTRRRGNEQQLAPEPLRVLWIWKLLAMLLPVALGAALVVAAMLGTGSASRTSAPGVAGMLGRQSGASPPPGRAGSAFSLPGWLPWTALAIVLVALVAGGVALWLARARARARAEPAERSAARAAVDAAIVELQTDTDPRGAVIAAYAAMERALAERGVTRSRSEAPREYLRRVLARVSETAREAGTLTELFEEARFSTHPIPERTRDLALAVLGTLRARLAEAQPR